MAADRLISVELKAQRHDKLGIEAVCSSSQESVEQTMAEVESSRLMQTTRLAVKERVVLSQVAGKVQGLTLEVI